MQKMGKLLIWLGGGLILGSALLAGNYIVSRNLKLTKPGPFTQTAQATAGSRVTEDTILKVDYIYLCGNQENTTMNVTPDMVGLKADRLSQRFTKADGWTVSADLPQTVQLEKVEWDVCPVHRNFRHLGTDGDFLAIYEGPLGVNTTLLQREEIKVSNLPQDLQAQLRDAMGFKGLAPAKQQALRERLEFDSDAKVNEFLDNLDEYRED